MVVMAMLSKILQFKHYAQKLSVKVLADPRVRTHPAHTQHAVVILLIVYFHPNSVARVGWEPGATIDN